MNNDGGIILYCAAVGQFRGVDRNMRPTGNIILILLLSLLLLLLLLLLYTSWIRRRCVYPNGIRVM